MRPVVRPTTTTAVRPFVPAALLFATALALILAILLAASAAHATRAGSDPDDPYRKIRVLWDDVTGNPEALDGLEPMGVEKDAWIDFLARNDEIARLRASGTPFRVLVEDLEEHAASLSRGPNFGIFHTYSETVAFLDSLHAANPTITTDKVALGTTWEGRTIWAMKISDNPNVEEPGEPEVLFDAVHHAREIITVETLINTMSWLCANYGTDDDATALVDTRQTWFVPIVNPDGLSYNETTNPTGGGMWRKNRRDNSGTSCEGVDLNRNYPYEWGLDSGSSSDPCSDVFRGPSAGSEPEIQAMMAFINAHQFVTQNSYHSVVGCILIPWGYSSSILTPDDATFRAMGAQMAAHNGYPVGTAYDMINYTASGGTFDWAYGEQTSKPKIYSFTTEVSGSGFWPAESERDQLVSENLSSDIYLMRAAGSWLGLDSFAVTGGDANGRLDPGETANLVTTVLNLGAITDATGVTVTIASDDSYLAFGSATASLGTIAGLATGDNVGDPFVVTALTSAPQGHIADVEVTMADASGFSATETLTLPIGQGAILYATDFELGAAGWTQDPSHTASTGTFVAIDPNPTGYQPGDDTTPAPGVNALVTAQNSSDGNADVDGGVAATRSPVIDCSGAPTARLTMSWFHGQRDAGTDPGDFFRIDLSNDDGATWPASLVALGDASKGPLWEQMVVNLHEHLPLTSTMRLRVQAADGPANGDIVEGGIDDVTVTVAGSGNAAPGPPAVSAPADGAIGQPTAPTLIVTNSVDPEGDPLTYGFRVYSDALLTTEVAAATGVAEGAGTTGWSVAPPLASGTYWWRAYAADSELQGVYMPAASFTVGSTVDAPLVASASPIALAAPRPNPSLDGADIAFTLPDRNRVRLDVFDVNGRHVRKLFEGVAEAGPNVRRWDGLDGGGRRVSGGVYFVQMQVAGQRLSRKIVRLP